MFSSIAISNHHTDKSLPPLLLLPSVIHLEAQQQLLPHHHNESVSNSISTPAPGSSSDGTGSTTPVSSYDSLMMTDNEGTVKSISPCSEASTMSSSLERLAFLATRKSSISSTAQCQLAPSQPIFHHPHTHHHASSAGYNTDGTASLYHHHNHYTTDSANDNQHSNNGNSNNGSGAVPGHAPPVILVDSTSAAPSSLSSSVASSASDLRSIAPTISRSSIHYESSGFGGGPRSPESSTRDSPPLLSAGGNGGGKQYSVTGPGANNISGSHSPPNSVSSHPHPHQHQHHQHQHQELTVIAASKYKRQRAGPSCDICRSKKIKCDATIMILFQDALITSLFNKQLHCGVNIGDLGMDWVNQIPEDIRRSLLLNELRLLKHVDKLIAFKPCTSCLKRKNCVCCFSKGFTRADINVFTNLCIKFGKRDSIDQFSVEDYRNCGYQL